MSTEKIQLACDRQEAERRKNYSEVRRGTKEESLNELFEIAQKRSTLLGVPRPKFLLFKNICAPDWVNWSPALIQTLDNCDTKTTIPMNWGGDSLHSVMAEASGVVKSYLFCFDDSVNRVAIYPDKIVLLTYKNE